MGSLESVIEAVLNDVTLAQDSANRYSSEIAKEYRNNPELAMFPVPNAAVRSFELKFKFGIGAFLEDHGTCLPLMAAGRDPLSETIKSAVAEIFRSLESGRLNLESCLTPPKLRLWTEQVDVFRSYVEQRACGKLAELVTHDRSSDRPDLVAAVSAEVNDALMRILKPLTSNGFPESWGTALGNDVAIAMDAAIPDPVRFHQSGRRGLPVIHDLQMLSGANSEMLAGITVQVDMRNFTWVTNETIDADGARYSRLIPHP